MVAPLEVRLSETNAAGKENLHTVQPDVLIFCDPSKADEKGLNGAPDWTLEVLSDSTAWKDETIKLALYERFGVKEYWIINPVTKLLLIYLLKNGKYGTPLAKGRHLATPPKTRGPKRIARYARPKGTIAKPSTTADRKRNPVIHQEP